MFLCILVFHQGLCDGSGTLRFIMDVIGCIFVS